MKRGQSLSINTIIVAALALVVFVIMAAIFSGKLRNLGQGLESCAAKQGQCRPCLGPDCGIDSCGPNSGVVPKTDCDKKPGPQVCCVSVFS